MVSLTYDRNNEQHHFYYDPTTTNTKGFSCGNQGRENTTAPRQQQEREDCSNNKENNCSSSSILSGQAARDATKRNAKNLTQNNSKEHAPFRRNYNQSFQAGRDSLLRTVLQLEILPVCSKDSSFDSTIIVERGPLSNFPKDTDYYGVGSADMLPLSTKVRAIIDDDNDDFSWDDDCSSKNSSMDVDSFHFSMVNEEENNQEGQKDHGPFMGNCLMTRRASQNVYGGEGFEIGDESIFTQYARHYDPWEVTTDPEGKPFEFHIIGTDGQDMDAQPHVLSPPQMHSLQEYLPFSKRGESFWLKYSMVRDGACKTSFLKHLRSDEYTVMAMETLDGEVFGAFTASPWTIQHGYFGTAESFVWRLKTPRVDDENLDLDLTYEERAKLERDIDVFKYSFSNNVAQICTRDRIAVGGGTTSFQKMVADGSLVEPNQFGFAISFDGSCMSEASSSPSVTFNSPGLSKLHSDGSKFKLLNVEVWSLTPCISVEEARKMAFQKIFAEQNTTPRSSQERNRSASI